MWVKLSQLHKSKFIKCFLIAVVLVFSYEVSKPKAFVPLAWAGAVLAGMAAETLITMGVKAVSKQVLKKQADDYAEQALASGAKFDFMGTNPYRNKDGSISLTPSANDRAKMAGLIGGALAGSMIGDGLNKSCEKPYDPELVHIDDEGYDFFHVVREYLLDSSGKKIGEDFHGYSKMTGDKLFSVGYFYHTYENVRTDIQFEQTAQKVRFHLYGYKINTTTEVHMGYNYVVDPALDQYNQTKKAVEDAGALMMDCGGVYFPDTVERVYPAPMDMSSTYKMPNDAELRDRPIIIQNVMPVTETPSSITWNQIEEQYTATGEDFQAVMDSNIENYVAKGVMAENIYTVEEVNNYYTDINYADKIETFEPEIGGGELPADPDESLPVPIPPVSELDHSMWGVMRNTYNYLDDGIDSSLAAMKGITDSAQGITTYLGTTMGWLPAEWRAVFTSAFVLGVFAHFLRR